MTSRSAGLVKAARRFFRWDENAPAVGRHRVALQRDRTALRLNMLVFVLLTPFMLSHLVAGRAMLALLIGVAQAALLANGLMIRAGQRAPVPFWLLVLALVLAVIGVILATPSHGALWAAPALFIAYFVLRRRAALLLSLLMLVGGSVAALVAEGGGPALAARVFASLTFMLGMINIVLNVVDDLQDALVTQTITDPLTGAFNRRHLVAQLAALPRPPAHTAAVNMLMAVDIDHFKSINDRYGHAAGDAVLRGLVAALKARLRPSDHLFRTGGEEFVVLLPRIGRADVQRLGEDLRGRVAEAALVPGHPERAVTVSIGVAAQRPDHDADAWQRATDEALYAAKHGGRDRVVVAD